MKLNFGAVTKEATADPAMSFEPEMDLQRVHVWSKGIWPLCPCTNQSLGTGMISGNASISSGPRKLQRGISLQAVGC